MWSCGTLDEVRKTLCDLLWDAVQVVATDDTTTLDHARKPAHEVIRLSVAGHDKTAPIVDAIVNALSPLRDDFGCGRWRPVFKGTRVLSRRIGL
jgi:hypothetical protein